MSRLAIAVVELGRFLAEDDVTVDEKGIVTHSAFLPETAEIIYGGIASLVIFGLLIKFAGPALTKSLSARTAKIQKELDGAAGDRASATSEAASIRQAKGDIEAERRRLLAEADAQAEAMIAEFHTRVDEEIAELRTRAAADIATARTRGTDELRSEISRLSSAAADRAVAESIDAATQQDLIESFIAKVGASQ
jgi:F-type H+-transporting ATPase subunit b